MVKQGDIIKIDFDPTIGHEQSGYRPAIVISNNVFNSRVGGLAIICPITNNIKNFPLHVLLDDRTTTTGAVLCDQIKTIDSNIRNYKVVEKMPIDILNKVLDVTISQIEVYEKD